MKIIGLTGNIGVGKSAVAALLQAKGAYVIDMDKVTRRALKPDGPGFAPVTAAFGASILSAAGAIDRQRLGAIVFSRPARLRELEGILHPIVFAMAQAELADAQAPLAVIEAIKLLEAGTTLRLCDEVWVVTAPRARQLERLVGIRGLSASDAESRMANQSSQAWKAARADRVIRNDGSLPALARQVDAIWDATMLNTLAQPGAAG